MAPKKVAQSDNDRSAPLPFVNEQLVMVAEMYYVSGLSQADIARTLRISQPQISRALDLARRLGIVRISIVDCDPRDHVLEEKLQKTFSLKTAVVIHTGKVEPDLGRKTVAHFAGPFVSRLADSAMNVAVAGGRTLLALAQTMKPMSGEKNKPAILQAMGCVGAVPEPWDSLEIGRRIAEKWKTQFLMLNTPAFFPNSKTRSTMMGLPQIRSVLDCLRHTDLALVGIGTLENSIFLERQTLRKPVRSELAKAGAIGEICGHFYNKEGKECQHPLRDCVAGIELDWLRRARDVVAVVIGADRAAAVVSAVRGGLVKSIITDSNLAAGMLDLAETSRKRGKPGRKPPS